MFAAITEARSDENAGLPSEKATHGIYMRGN